MYAKSCIFTLCLICSMAADGIFVKSTVALFPKFVSDMDAVKREQNISMNIKHYSGIDCLS